jgi:hypothetical protein
MASPIARRLCAFDQYYFAFMQTRNGCTMRFIPALSISYAIQGRSMPEHGKLRSAGSQIYFASLPFNIFTSFAARREKYKPTLLRHSERALAMAVENYFAGREAAAGRKLFQSALRTQSTK